MRFGKTRDDLGISNYRIIDNQIWNEIANYFAAIRDRERALRRNCVTSVLQFYNQRALVKCFVEPRLKLVEHFHRGANDFAAWLFVDHPSVLSVNGADGISDIEGKAAKGSGERVGKRASFKSVV